MSSSDTIVAISSAVGPAARMLVRVSGPGTTRIAASVGVPIDEGPADARAAPLTAGLPASAGSDKRPATSPSQTHARVIRSRLRFAGFVLPAWIYVFRSPRSYTGEDLVEFHIPGNPLCAKLLVDALIAAGARPAGAGEFTARAFFNERIDLTEAEGVAATIAAQNEQELDAARRLLAGELSRRLAPVMEAVARTLALVEVGIDFAEEQVSFLSAGEVFAEASATGNALRNLLSESARFEPLSHEPRLVLVGRPNAGKSTLLNALAGSERAVTSPVAGTTRDAISAEVTLRRGIVRVTDVAGIEAEAMAGERVGPGSDAGGGRDGPLPPAQRAINDQMRQRAMRELESADFVLLVRDCRDPGVDPVLPRAPDLVVRSKSDLLARPSLPVDDPPVPSPPYAGERVRARRRSGGHRGSTEGPAASAVPDVRPLTPALSPEYGGEGVRPPEPMEGGRNGALPSPGEQQVSALTGVGLDALRDAMDELAFGRATARSTLALNARHLGAIGEAIAALDRAAALAADAPAPELLALELREALDALGRVLGQVTPDDLLGKIFASFCIGK